MALISNLNWGLVILISLPESQNYRRIFMQRKKTQECKGSEMTERCRNNMESIFLTQTDNSPVSLRGKCR